MDIACVKRSLVEQIQILSAQPELYCRSPGRDFSRKRKLSFCRLVSFLLNMQGGSLTNEIIDFFCCGDLSVSPSAVVQMRDKLKAEALRALLLGFNQRMEKLDALRPENGLRLLAVDGSEIQIPTNPEDKESFFPGANGQAPYNMIRLNAMYDLVNNTYTDAIIQKRMNWNEGKALVEMVESSAIKSALVIADRGYESYNVMAHIRERGWFYLIRVKNKDNGIVRGLDLPDDDEFDLDISLNMTRSQTNAVKEMCRNKNCYRYVPPNTKFDYLPSLNGVYGSEPRFYTLPFRILRIRISEDLVETIVTNLPRTNYSPSKIKELYAMRWGIETSFRSLKHTVGMLHFHSKKAECIFQEVYAALVIYNFTEWITAQVVIRNGDRKHTYKANFSVAVHVCRKLLSGNLHPPDVESLIARYIIPIRPNRKFERRLVKHKGRYSINFTYRIA